MMDDLNKYLKCNTYIKCDSNLNNITNGRYYLILKLNPENLNVTIKTNDNKISEYSLIWFDTNEYIKRAKRIESIKDILS